MGLEQYRKKNILKLDFFCEPDERIPEKLLQLYLQKKEQSPVRWKGISFFIFSRRHYGICADYFKKSAKCSEDFGINKK